MSADKNKKLMREIFAGLAAGGRSLFQRSAIPDGDIVAAEARGDNYSASGECYGNQYCPIFRFENGKIAEMREYMDAASCEKVLGHYPASAAAGA